ncbi:ROK family protein [Salisediminibacterium halotolerans]|uniref:Beta-glucoside kinase n=1 Tax=Salisediminibacterium halotolerans TaxID=517425 RepID=A0A1H9R9S1_9BACI|nr:MULTISPECIES: ROK family protein [Salisediminibacterium]RLJ78292.1 beta-glucoside kinase [Actinophytocola xinjiangensis]RPE88369.1 beta-glucoside kinase [Salisediminibacterium halotolerans]TWG37268.1 beta-glucoside kinase [Salisediminibacterium halotolerans]SER69661.1 beta-glucoside kinase [Salisediminibacterium haloalkalitolerans]GEL08319.1 glucokinase [Salisediminibacterium halotolerans]
MTENQYLSFDIGGTAIKWGLLKEDGTIVKKDSFPTGGWGRETLVRQLEETIEQFKSEINGISVCLPGFINPDGFIEYGGAIKGFNQFHFRKHFEEKFGLPVSVENDVNCVAMAEKWQGNASDLSDFFCMTVGTGIGGALVINDQLYRGHSFQAGECGFMITAGLHADLPEHDSLSKIASTYGLREKYAANKKLKLEDVSGEDVFAAYEQNDPIAIKAVQRFYESIAIGIFNITSVINPQKVLIGGGITGRPSFIDELRTHLDYVDMVFNVEVDICHFKNDAGLIGALAHYFTIHPLESEKRTV